MNACSPLIPGQPYGLYIQIDTPVAPTSPAVRNVRS